jgi:transcriptional regulator with XRE-family HTH domain
MGSARKLTRRNALVAARVAAGFTQEELAARLGVERSTVYRWESGETTPLPMLRPGLARLLGLENSQLAVLLGDSGDGDAHASVETSIALSPSPGSTPHPAPAAFSDLATLDMVYQQILTAIRNAPESDTDLHTEVLRRTRQISKTIELRVAEDRRFELRALEDFERRYSEQVISVLGRMELFGIGRGRTHSMDNVYVDAAVARSDRGYGEEDDGLSGSGLDVASAFLDHPRVFLRGGAGAGKSTLLQWLAVSACRATSPTSAAWGHVVPFLVQLRRFRPSELPKPEAFPKTIAAAISAEMPDG